MFASIILAAMTQRNSLKTASTGLAGALALAAGNSAYGDIIVGSPMPSTVPPALTNVAGGPTTTVNWDVNGDGIQDFTFTNRFPNTTTTGVVWQMNMNPFGASGATNGVLGYQGAFVRYAFALQPNANIGPGGAFSTVAQVVLGSQYRSGGVPMFYGGFAAGPNGNGAVTPGTQAFAGFRFNAADGTHYGWIRLSVNSGRIDFVSAAWESTPNTAIAAGAVPEPGTMALLALGAVGVVGTAIKRRRRA